MFLTQCLSFQSLPFLDGRHLQAGEYCSIRYLGTDSKFKVIKISGDFGATEPDVTSIIDVKLKDLKISAQESQDQGKSHSVYGNADLNATKNELKGLKSPNANFVYYVSETETVANIVADDTDNETKLNSTVNTENLVTFESIGGFSSQLEAIKETIALPLQYPDLFRSCGKFSL